MVGSLYVFVIGYAPTLQMHGVCVAISPGTGGSTAGASLSSSAQEGAERASQQASRRSLHPEVPWSNRPGQHPEVLDQRTKDQLKDTLFAFPKGRETPNLP